MKNLSPRIIVNCDQGSQEWFDLRAKRMTASPSHAQAIGNGGKGLTTYIYSKMQEFYSSKETESFSSYFMDRGRDLESSAGYLYEISRGIVLKRIGFVIYDDHVGASPDYYCGEDGLVEIKCPDDKAHFKMLISEEVESKYFWQMQMQMLVCEKDWCDFVSFNPNFKQELFVKRFHPDPDSFEHLLKGFEIGRNLIRLIERKMEGK